MTDLSTSGAAPAAVPSTTLFSLPTEILSKIASDVAPDGGAKAGPLRLVCKALNAVAKRTALSSVLCIVNSETGSNLLAAIGRDGSALGTLVTSFHLDLKADSIEFVAPIAAAAIERLVRLERLHISGEIVRHGHDHRSTELVPLAIVLAFRGFSATLQHLCLERLDLSAAQRLQFWADRVVKIDVLDCAGWDGFYIESTPPSCLDVVALGSRFTPDDDWQQEASDVIGMVTWAAPKARHIELHWSEADEGEHDDRLDDATIWLRSPLKSFHLRGLPSLWDGTDPQWPHVLRLLTAVGTTKLHKLTLPISMSEIMMNVFEGRIPAPTVTTLCLENEVGRQLIPLNFEVFELLRSLLLSSFPSIETLHLDGWQAPRAIGQIAPALLVQEHSMVFLLLALLASTRVTTVRMKGHTHVAGAYAVRFRREKGSAEWSSEVFDLS